MRSANGLGTRLRRLLELTDGELEAIYRRDHPFYTPRFTPIMKALADGKPMSIKAIAERSSISHSAASQTIAKMVEVGLVRLVTGADRRSREVALTKKGHALIPWLHERWRATALAAEGLESKLSYPLSDLLSEAIAALERQGFADRIRLHERSLQEDT